jgi:haloalkane dehalogenase
MVPHQAGGQFRKGCQNYPHLTAFDALYASTPILTNPTLTWPRQLPIEGEPADVVEIVNSYAAWLAASPVPKLFVNAEPGTISMDEREFCRGFPNQTEVTVRGLHFIQEDSPDEIGEAVAKWYSSLQAN